MSITKPISILFLAQTCVGINIVLSKGLIDHINPVIILTIRFTLASIFMTFLLLISKDPNKFKLNLTSFEWCILIINGLGAGVLFNLIMLRGLHFTDATSAGLITSLLPAIVICINVIFLKQKLTTKMATSLVIAILGLLLINYNTIGASSKNTFIGNMLVLAALIPEGMYYALSKAFPIKINKTLNVVLLNLINLPILFPIIFFMPKYNWSVITIYDYMILAAIGITTGLFFILWQKGIDNIDASYAALSTAFMPVSTVILAYIILGENINISKFIGMIMVISSIMIYAKK